MAKYNEAVELEHLKRYEEALCVYELAQKWMGLANLPGQNGLEGRLDRAISVVREKIKEE